MSMYNVHVRCQLSYHQVNMILKAVVNVQTNLHEFDIIKVFVGKYIYGADKNYHNSLIMHVIYLFKLYSWMILILSSFQVDMTVISVQNATVQSSLRKKKFSFGANHHYLPKIQRNTLRCQKRIFFRTFSIVHNLVSFRVVPKQSFVIFVLDIRV